jgi:hypothetical protein
MDRKRSEELKESVLQEARAWDETKKTDIAIMLAHRTVLTLSGSTKQRKGTHHAIGRHAVSPLPESVKQQGSKSQHDDLDDYNISHQSFPNNMRAMSREGSIRASSPQSHASLASSMISQKSTVDARGSSFSPAVSRGDVAKKEAVNAASAESSDAFMDEKIMLNTRNAGRKSLSFSPDVMGFSDSPHAMKRPHSTASVLDSKAHRQSQSHNNNKIEPYSSSWLTEENASRKAGKYAVKTRYTGSKDMKASHGRARPRSADNILDAHVVFTTNAGIVDTFPPYPRTRLRVFAKPPPKPPPPPPQSTPKVWDVYMADRTHNLRKSNITSRDNRRLAYGVRDSKWAVQVSNTKGGNNNKSASDTDYGIQTQNHNQNECCTSPEDSLQARDGNSMYGGNSISEGKCASDAFDSVSQYGPCLPMEIGLSVWPSHPVYDRRGDGEKSRFGKKHWLVCVLHITDLIWVRASVHVFVCLTRCMSQCMFW